MLEKRNFRFVEILGGMKSAFGLRWFLLRANSFGSIWSSEIFWLHLSLHAPHQTQLTGHLSCSTFFCSRKQQIFQRLNTQSFVVAGYQQALISISNSVRLSNTPQGLSSIGHRRDSREVLRYHRCFKVSEMTWYIGNFLCSQILYPIFPKCINKQWVDKVCKM